MKVRFFVCNHCNDVVAMVSGSEIPDRFCDEKMQEIIPGTSEGAKEKHIPVYDVKGDIVSVSVGETEHPMTPEHYIDWVCLETEGGLQFKNLDPSMSPNVSFCISKGDKVKSVHSFCNQHGLWKA